MTGIQRDRGREEKRGEKGKEKWRGETDGTICTQQNPNRGNKFYIRGELYGEKIRRNSGNHIK